MISVSDILARVAVAQAGSEGPELAVSLSGDEPAASAELLSFITRFAEPGLPLPVSSLPLGDVPVDGELVAKSQLFAEGPTEQSQDVSSDPVSPLLAPEVMGWSIEQDAALGILFNPSWSGTALPSDGESLPNEAAIVAALLDAAPTTEVQSEAELARELAAELKLERAFDSARQLGLPTVEFQTHNIGVAVAASAAVLINRQGSQALTGEGAVLPPQQTALASTTDPSVWSSPVPASTADAGDGLRGNNAPAVSGSGVLSVTTGPVGEGLDASQTLVKVVGLSSSAESGGSGQEGHPREFRTPFMTPAPVTTPARDLAPASVPASSAVTDQARTMDFLLQNEGHERTWGRERWAEGVGRQLMIMTRDGLGSARLRLDPPSLGVLTIQIQMTEQGTSVSFVAQHPSVRDALEQQTSRLQELFQDQELNLLDVSVSDQDARERGAMDNVPEPWQDASDEVDAEDQEQVAETTNHHLINERV